MYKLSRYVLLLKELKKCTLQRHAEFDHLNSAIAAMVAVTNSVNSAVAAEKNRLQVQRFLQDFEGGPPSIFTSSNPVSDAHSNASGHFGPTSSEGGVESVDLMHPTRTLLKTGLLMQLETSHGGIFAGGAAQELQVCLFSDVLVLTKVRPRKEKRLTLQSVVRLRGYLVTSLPDTSTMVRCHLQFFCVVVLTLSFRTVSRDPTFCFCGCVAWWGR